MIDPPLSRKVVLYVAASPAGRDKWDIEREFPDANVGTVLTKLERKGQLRAERQPAKRHGKVYHATGKKTGPQEKLEAFVGVDA